MTAFFFRINQSLAQPVLCGSRSVVHHSTSARASDLAFPGLWSECGVGCGRDSETPETLDKCESFRLGLSAVIPSRTEFPCRISVQLPAMDMMCIIAHLEPCMSLTKEN